MHKGVKIRRRGVRVVKAEHIRGTHREWPLGAESGLQRLERLVQLVQPIFLSNDRRVSAMR